MLNHENGTFTDPCTVPQNLDSDFIQLGAAIKVPDFFKNETFSSVSGNTTSANGYKNFYVYDQNDSLAENKNPMGFTANEELSLI